MYFIPHGNKLYRWAVETQPLVRYAVTVIFLCTIIAIWYYGIYGYLETYKTNLIKKGENNRLQIAEQKKAAKNVAELENSIASTHEQINQRMHHGKLDVAALLIETAGKHAVIVKGFTLGTSSDTGLWNQTELTTNIEGTVENLAAWCTAMSATTGIYCNNLNIQRVSDTIYHLACTVSLVTAQSKKTDEKKSLQL